jgi:cell division septum initiation protein DivIVA
MGWGRMLLLGNWGQQMDIEDQKLEIEDLKRQINSSAGAADNVALENRIALLEKENGELRLYLASLIKYLGHRGILRQKEFETLVETIDEEDGDADSSYKGDIMK